MQRSPARLLLETLLRSLGTNLFNKDLVDNNWQNEVFCWWSTGFHLEGIADISEQQIFIHSNECIPPDPKLRSYITKIMKPTGWKLWQCLNKVNIITIISHLCLLLKNICRFLLIMIDFYGLKLNRFFRFQKW